MKRFIALLLTLVLALSLAACAPAGQTEETVSDFEAPAEAYTGALPLVQEGEDNVITIGIRVNANVLDYDNNAYTLWLEEQTGVDIQFVQFAGKAGDVATQLSLMMAGGEELPDILVGNNGIDELTGEQYGADGYFVDLVPYFEHYSYYFKGAFDKIFEGDTEVYDTIMKLAYDSTGEHIYGFPTFEEVPLDTPETHAWINQDWLDALDLEAPTNIEELYDVLVAFRDNDPNGNGLKDEIPMTGRTTNFDNIENFLVNAFIFSNPTYHYNVTDGELWTPYVTDEYRQALVYMNKLVSEGLLSTLTWTQTSSEKKSLMNPMDNVYTVGVIPGHPDLSFDAGHDSMRAYVPLAPLADATGKGGYGPMRYHTVHNRVYISADCDNPVLAFKLLDFMCCEESYLRQRWGEYGVDWKYAEEGQTGNLGGEADIVVMNSTAFSSPNASCWHLVESIASEKYWEYAVDLSDETNWDTQRVTKLVENYNNYVEAGMPEEVFYFAAYTEDEQNELTDFQTDLTDYIKIARAEFATGVKDPSDDGAWQTYLDGVNSLRYDDFIAIAQAGYDRMK